MKKITAAVLLLVFVIIMISILSGCQKYIYNHQKAKAERFYAKRPGELSKVCSVKFAITDSLFKGRDFVNIDTSFAVNAAGPIVIDSLLRTLPDSVIYKTNSITFTSGLTFGGSGITGSRYIPLTQTITIRHHKVDTLRIENTAKYDSLKRYSGGQLSTILDLKKSLSDKDALAKKYEHDSIVRLWIIIGMITAICAVFIVKFYFF